MSEEDVKQEELDAAIADGPPKTMRLTPQQLAITLLFEGQCGQLQIAANQLGGFLKETDAAEVLLSSMRHIDKAKVRMQAKWAKTNVEDAEVVP